MPRSRENAYHVREALVRPAMPQNSWPIVQMISTALAAGDVRNVVMIGIGPPPPSVTAFSSETAKSSARRTNQPMIAEMTTDRQTPCEAATAASFVSSAVWADASYPVIV